MKQLFVIAISSMMIFGCSSGTKPPSESDSAAPEAVKADSSEVTQSSEYTDMASSTDSSSTSTLGSKFDELRIGMKDKEVIELLGKPTARETISKDAKNNAEDWYYGDNQKVRMISGEVNFVVKNVAHHNELLKQLKDANNNKDEAEVRRITDEITKGQK